jgi:hypothetical protein
MKIWFPATPDVARVEMERPSQAALPIMDGRTMPLMSNERKTRRSTPGRKQTSHAESPGGE